ncbi:MAG: HAMP domain-containing histidine kinase [Candidatus Ancillula sp.]|jgi:signal transduction histidine kinase|nr:HAMP domain-containing histidine kinase [Candidatus Ancillula sp.]
MKKKVSKYILLAVVLSLLTFAVLIFTTIFQFTKWIVSDDANSIDIAIVEASGEVIYSDWGRTTDDVEKLNLTENPQINDALQNIFAFNENFDVNKDAKRDYFAIKIADGLVLEVSGETKKVVIVGVLFLLIVLVEFGMAVLVSRLISRLSAKTFAKTLEEITFEGNDEVTSAVLQQYPELKPFHERISGEFHTKMNFLSNVSHELKRPLNNIRQRLLLLKMKAKQTNVDLIDDIDKDIEHLAKTADLLLRLQEVDNKKLENNWEIFDLKDLIMHVISETDFAGRKLKKVLQSAVIKANRDLVWLLVDNLIDNAVKYSEEKVKIQIHVRSDCFIVDFFNDGEAIPEDDQQKIFSAFYKSQKYNDTTSKGFGVGLALVDRIVRLHGFTISVLSTPGDKTRFRLQIPKQEFVNS